MGFTARGATQAADEALFSISLPVFISKEIPLQGNMELRKTEVLSPMFEHSLLMWIQNFTDDFGLLTATAHI